MAADDQDGLNPRETLDDGEDRQLTMAQLRAQLELARQAAAEGKGPDPLATPSEVRPRVRDDELLANPPPSERLGGFSGWNAGRRARGLLLGAFVVVALTVAILSWQIAERREFNRLHPLPEVEATIAPGTPRDMTISDGQFRLGIAREPPSINVVHLPDRDITLAEGVDKAQFKVEVVEGKTVKITVLTGRIVETLHEGAEPLL
jgi:hypothetical protein